MFAPTNHTMMVMVMVMGVAVAIMKTMMGMMLSVVLAPNAYQPTKQSPQRAFDLLGSDVQTIST